MAFWYWREHQGSASYGCASCFFHEPGWVSAGIECTWSFEEEIRRSVVWFCLHFVLWVRSLANLLRARGVNFRVSIVYSVFCRYELLFKWFCDDRVWILYLRVGCLFVCVSLFFLTFLCVHQHNLECWSSSELAWDGILDIWKGIR